MLGILRFSLGSMDQVAQVIWRVQLNSTAAIRVLGKTNAQPAFRQDVFDDVRPLDNSYNVGFTGNFGEFRGHDARLLQAVKVKMVHLQPWLFVYLADGKCRAGDYIGTAQAAHQAARQRRLTAAEVTDKLNHLAALQLPADPLAELFGSF